MKPKGISIHWPAFKADYIAANPGQKMVDNIRRMHVQGNGWSDIGYHYVVHNDGKGVFRVYDGRPDTREGAHTYGYNDWLGVSVIYPMDTGLLPEAQLQAVATLVAALAKHYKIPLTRQYVKGHREFVGHKSNQCPGEPMFRQMDRLLMLAHKVNQPPAVPAQPKPPVNDKPDNMIGHIDLEINGKIVEGLLYDDQAMVHIPELKALGITFEYVPAQNGQKHKVILRKS